jgi:hypothetical protein
MEFVFGVRHIERDGHSGMWHVGPHQRSTQRERDFASRTFERFTIFSCSTGEGYGIIQPQPESFGFVSTQ